MPSLRVWKQRQRTDTVEEPSMIIHQGIRCSCPSGVVFFSWAWPLTSLWIWGSAPRPAEKMPSHNSESRAELHIFLAVSDRRWQPWGSYEELQLLLLLLIITIMIATVHKLWATSNYLLTTHSQISTAQRANSGPASTQTQNTILFNTNKQHRVH